MKELFIAKKFQRGSAELIERINGILDAYDRQGYDLSLRQLYYQLVAKNIIKNNELNYKMVGSLVSDARYAGLIDWNMIKDRGRESLANSHWESPKDFVTSTAHAFKINHWLNMPNYVEVMVEKQALEGVLLPVCGRLGVPFTSNKGYSSSSAMYDAGKRMNERYLAGKQIHVIYLGDHDPSGIDMSRDVLERLAMFAQLPEWDCVTVHRVALNMKQVKELNPPENPAKITDSRFASYVAKFGHSSWELDAIEPKRLAEIVTDAITDLMDEEEFDRVSNLQKEGREKLINHAEKML